MKGDPDLRLFGFAAAFVAAVYLATTAQTVLGGDNGEFASIFAQGGVPHPSGYPLYALYLGAMRWVPGISAAHSAAIATALLGAAALFAVRWACRSWGSSGPSANVAAGLFGVTGLMWKSSTHAEVFALHALLGALIVAAAGPHGSRSPLRRAALLGLLAGLGLCNNHSIVTLAPLGLYGAWRAVVTARSRLGAVAVGLGGLALGLSPYAYLAAGAGRTDALVWGETGSVAGLLHHFLRADYGTTSLAISDASLDPVGHVARLVGHLATEYLVLPALLGLVGMVLLVLPGRRPSATEAAAPRRQSYSSEAIPLPLHRRQVRGSRSVRTVSSVIASLPVPAVAGRLYAATFVLAGPVFVGSFNLPLESLSLLIVERFYLLPMVLLAPPIAIGLDLVLGHRLGSLEVQGPLMVGVLCLSIFVSYDEVREHHRPDVELYLINSLHTAEPGAVVLGTGDHRLYGFWYARTVLGVRRDVAYVDPLMLSYDWYRRRVEGELGRRLEGVEGAAIDTVALALGLLEGGRPVYLTNRFSSAIPRSLPTYPIGTLIRVVAPGRPMPRPEVLEQLNMEVAQQYDYHTPPPSDPNGWAAYVERDYTRPWQVLADTYDAMGRHADAERCRNRHIIVE